MCKGLGVVFADDALYLWQALVETKGHIGQTINRVQALLAAGGLVPIKVRNPILEAAFAFSCVSMLCS